MGFSKIQIRIQRGLCERKKYGTRRYVRRFTAIHTNAQGFILIDLKNLALFQGSGLRKIFLGFSEIVWEKNFTSNFQIRGYLTKKIVAQIQFSLWKNHQMFFKFLNFVFGRGASPWSNWGSVTLSGPQTPCRFYQSFHNLYAGKYVYLHIVSSLTIYVPLSMFSVLYIVQNDVLQYIIVGFNAAVHLTYKTADNIGFLQSFYFDIE